MASIRGQVISGNPTYLTVAANPPAEVPPHVSALQPAQQETNYVGGSGQSNDSLIARDRHAVVNRGHERTGRIEGGQRDPLLDGPPRPSLRTINRTINQQSGSKSRNQDDLTRAYNRDPKGTWIGQQDGSIVPIYGGTPGVWVPYGSYAGYTQGPVKGIQSPQAYNSQHDQPQKVFAGPPHGLHTVTLPDYASTLGRYMAMPQMAAARVDRPSNSRIAGQSYSQTVAPQGQVGTVGVQTMGQQRSRQLQIIPGSGWRGA